MASNQGMGSLATIIKRLEAATSRLEDLAESQASVQTHAKSGAPSAAATAASPSAPSGPASVPASTPAPPPPPPADPPSVQAYDANVTPALETYVQLSSGLNPIVKEQAAIVSQIFTAQRALILLAASCTKPTSDSAFATLLGPMGTGIGAAVEIKDKNRSNRDFYNHLCVVAEGIPALGWVQVTPKPAPHIAEMKNAAEFYSNRVIKEFKDKDKAHVEWARSFSALLEALRKYVFDHHTTGLTWNPKGTDPSKYTPPSSAGSAPGGAPPPPPPPPPAPAAPPPPPPAGSPAPATKSSTADPTAFLAQINQGSDITKGLKHVSKDQMTHKNPELRKGGSVPASVGSGERSSTPPSPSGAKKPPVRPAKPSALAGKKPSKMVLEGNKWAVEFFENEKNLVIEQTEINHIINLFGLKSCVVQIRGKVNAVTLVNCSKTSVLIDTVVSSVSITSSPSFTVQVTGVAPTIQLDSTDGGQIYLSQAAADVVEITVAKCSAINVSVPEKNEKGEEEEGLFVERAVPEMLKVVVKDGKLVPSIVEASG